MGPVGVVARDDQVRADLAAVLEEVLRGSGSEGGHHRLAAGVQPQQLQLGLHALL